MTITSELDIYNHELGENCKTIPFSCSYTAYFDYLATVLWRVSVRFKRLVSDSSLWTSPSPDLDSANNATSHPLEWVTITAGGDPEKVEFVVQKCLYSAIRDPIQLTKKSWPKSCRKPRQKYQEKGNFPVATAHFGQFNQDGWNSTGKDPLSK